MRINYPVRLVMGRRVLWFNIVAFAFLFVGYFLTTGTELVESEAVKNLFRLSALLLFLTNIAVQRAFRWQYIAGLALLCFYIAINSSPTTLNIAFLLIGSASLYHLSSKEVAVAVIVPTVFVLILHAVLLSTENLVIADASVGERTRTALGFTNANQASVIYLSLAILAAFTHLQFRTKTSMLLTVISYSAVFLVVQFTDSRTPFFALLLLLGFQILGLLFLRFKIYRTLIVFLGAVSPIIASVITLLLTISANPSLNTMLSLRPAFFSQFVSDITLLDLLIGWDAAGIDNLFLMLLSNLGLVGSTFVLLYVTYRVYRLHSEYIPFIIVLMAVSVFESFLLRPEIPISIVFFHLLIAPWAQRPIFPINRQCEL